VRSEHCGNQTPIGAMTYSIRMIFIVERPQIQVPIVIMAKRMQFILKRSYLICVWSGSGG